MSRHLNEDAPLARTLIPELTIGFSSALAKAMARRREERTSSALAFALDLAASPGPAAPRLPSGLALPRAPSPTPPGGSPRTPTPAGHATPIPGWDPAQLQRLERELTPLVGPMAGILVRRAARQVQDDSELRRRLAQEIPDGQKRQAFLASGGPPSRPPAALSQLATRPPGPSGYQVDSDPRLPTAERLLAEEIGPLARVLVHRVAKRASSWDAFVEEVCGEVADPSRRGSIHAALARLWAK
jgi:serine/threonine-protein kinase